MVKEDQNKSERDSYQVHTDRETVKSINLNSLFEKEYPTLTNYRKYEESLLFLFSSQWLMSPMYRTKVCF